MRPWHLLTLTEINWAFWVVCSAWVSFWLGCLDWQLTAMGKEERWQESSSPGG
jgi:hypothetical protein